MDGDTDEQKKMRVVQAEVNRMKLLPASSAYVIHRLKVLNKMTQLLSVAPEVIWHHYPQHLPHSVDHSCVFHCF
jgi:hypothetical protein